MNPEHDDPLTDTPATLARPTGPWWRRPSVLALSFVVLCLGLAVLWPLLTARPVTPGALTSEPEGMPWQIDVPGDGSSQVFGLNLGRDRLGDVQARFPDDLSVGMMVERGHPPALEALVDGFRAGFITGKLVLAFEADSAWLERAVGRAPAHQVNEGGRSRRYNLAADDVPQAQQARLVALAFIPSARLDEATVVQRFGAPPERIQGPDGELQLMYPERGLSVVLPPAQGESAGARAVVQYVAPAEFEARLRGPLRAASGPAR